jgi:hypothetical protein
VALSVALAVSACAMNVKRPAARPTAKVPGASLWERPTDLARRDLFHGVWGADRAPAANGTYALVEIKHTGGSRMRTDGNGA